MRPMRPSFALTLAGFLLLAACGPKPAAPLASSASEAAVWSPNGWSEAERTEFHHLPEGSELMPYALLSNVVSSKTGRPFLENLQRFGFIPDPVSSSNVHGLPIGLTTVRSR